MSRFYMKSMEISNFVNGNEDVHMKIVNNDEYTEVQIKTISNNNVCSIDSYAVRKFTLFSDFEKLP